MNKIFSLVLLFLIIACNNPESNESPDESLGSWSEILEHAKGKTVNLMMWQGDPYINDYMVNYVVPKVKDSFDITLNISNGQGNQIVTILMTEIEAGKENSEIDMMWINGETFFQLRQIDALHGPFTSQLPNARFIDFDNPFIKYDFQQEVDGYECPWGSIQQAFIYDQDKVSDPPMNRDELKAWVEAHPGRFTFSNDFNGMSLLKAFLMDLAGGPKTLSGPFNEDLYQKYSAQLWTYINEIKPYFWKQGETFPASTANMHQMYANGELDITMSMNDAEVDNKVYQGLFPESSRAYVMDIGSIRNSHYMGIAAHANNKAGAMVVINFMISPAAQLEKANPQVWGDGIILAIEKLPEPWRERFQHLPNRKYAPTKAEIESKGLAEPAPEYMIRLFDDFRKYVIEAP